MIPVGVPPREESPPVHDKPARVHGVPLHRRESAARVVDLPVRSKGKEPLEVSAEGRRELGRRRPVALSRLGSSLGRAVLAVASLARDDHEVGRRVVSYRVVSLRVVSLSVVVRSEAVGVHVLGPVR
jgi:hypothetical protein